MCLDLSLHASATPASAPESARAGLGHREDARRRARRMPPEGGRRGTRQRRGGRPRGAGGIQSVGATCIGSAEAWSAAAVGIISALGSRLSALCSLLSALCSLLSALCSLLSALCSLLIASSEFAPDAPSCGVRIAASDCAVAGARPSTASRSIRIDIRPFGESDGFIFDLYGHMINWNVQNPLPPRRIGPGHGGEMVSGCRPWPGPVVLGIGGDARGPCPAGPCLRRRTARPRPRVRCGRGHPGERGQDAGLEADVHGRARREFPPRSATARMLTGEPSEPHRPGNALRRDQRARDRAELVTDDKTARREPLQALTGERLAALDSHAQHIAAQLLARNGELRDAHAGLLVVSGTSGQAGD